MAHKDKGTFFAAGHALPPGLADAELLDEKGQPVRLAAILGARSTVVAFVRHFG